MTDKIGTCEDSHLLTSYSALVHVLVCNQRALHTSYHALVPVLVCNQRALHRSRDAMHVLVCNQRALHTSYSALVHVLVCNQRALHTSRGWHHPLPCVVVLGGTPRIPRSAKLLKVPLQWSTAAVDSMHRGLVPVPSLPHH